MLNIIQLKGPGINLFECGPIGGELLPGRLLIGPERWGQVPGESSHLCRDDMTPLGPAGQVPGEAGLLELWPSHPLAQSEPNQI